MKENDQIFQEREQQYNTLGGMRVGDWVKLPNGEYTRITHVWRNENGSPFSVQTGGTFYGSFYLGDGYISYSGGLDPGLDPKDLIPTHEKKKGQIWFFKNDHWKADNGIDYIMLFRVFLLRQPIEAIAHSLRRMRMKRVPGELESQ